MDYYLWLANQQYERFLDFVQENPKMDLIDQRVAFFGQRYEVHLSHSIAHGIHAFTNSEGKPST